MGAELGDGALEGPGRPRQQQHVVVRASGQRRVDGARELPSGIVTALIGAPLLLLLLRRRA